ncbi:ureidoglycolate lyase [Kiloniella laminariae]|uniref:Ureidoglycolate lyase n=1 Tax=Kiloniella laminariae TaxID=454162 RepID=A0ABT4LJW7_9PROT|nr:ureidoglycolate lyase [Kiloniella laminariae]MCZ4281372.1 ureidoglycolate lyase [Kiloniella laminariae]
MATKYPDRKKGFDYMAPPVPGELPLFDIPLVRATPESLEGFGTLVTDYMTHPVEIVRWPAQGWRSIDEGTGDEAGHLEGIFEFWWEGDFLLGENMAVKDRYILGWSELPAKARRNNPDSKRDQLLIWHANYHPDGAQLFYPLDNRPFVTALAKTGDDMQPEDWVAFYCDGSAGICIHPGIWHEAITPLSPRSRFYDKQGAVHARVSCNFTEEFGVFMRIPLTPDDI